MKAQAAVEYMIIVGLILAIILPISAYVWQQTETEKRTREAEIAANSIAASADNIWAQGIGAKTTLNVYFPAGYDPSESSVSNKLVRLKIQTPAGKSDILSTSKANLTGSLPSSSGYKVITLQLTDNAINVSSS